MGLHLACASDGGNTTLYPHFVEDFVFALMLSHLLQSVASNLIKSVDYFGHNSAYGPRRRLFPEASFIDRKQLY